MIVGFGLAIGTLALNLVAHFLIGASGASENRFQIVAFGAFFYFLGFVCWVMALRHLTVPEAYPVLALGIVVAPVIQWFAGGQNLPWTAVAALIWITLGYLAFFFSVLSADS